MKKSKVTKKNSFEKELLNSLKSANDYHDGKVTLKSSVLDLPEKPKQFTSKDIKKIREKLNVSQPILAIYLGVSDGSVKAWEQGDSHPSGSSLRLLEIADRSPDDFIELICG